MKPPIDRQAAVVTTVLVVLVVSICTTIFVAHVDIHAHTGGSGAATTHPG